MSKTLSQRLTATAEGKRLYAQEEFILDATELICEMMERKGVSRSELARRLGCTKGNVSQLLDGETNMTARTISDVFHALGCRPKLIVASPKATAERTWLGEVWSEIVPSPSQWVGDSTSANELTALAS